MFDKTPNSTAKGAVPATAITPRNTGERKNFHYIQNIFDPDKHPPEDLSKYVVPQENELIYDVEQGTIYRASYVDWQGTLKTTLVPWRLTNIDAGNTTEQDWIFGLRGGPLLGEALLSVDYSVRPNVARVDSTIMRPGAAYAKVYLGNDASDNGTVISAGYDKNLVLLTNKVPCKLAEIVDRTNESIMTTGPFSVTETAEGLPDGKRCTLVFYDVGGEFIPPVQPLMVQHSAYMRDHQIGMRYVTEVKLISPWFTDTINPERLLVPININLLAVELRCEVHWNDGKSEIFPVNGTKCSLKGLQQHRPTYPGQATDVVLTYRLDDDEQNEIAREGTPNHYSRTYTIEAGNVKGAYSPRIFTYPQWDAQINGWILKHFLYDLDRKSRVDITDLVTLNSLSPPWRPSSYGTEQAMIFNINLRDVSPTYESVIFIQHTQITLLRDVRTEGKRWQVNFSFDMPVYGGKTIIADNAMTTTTFDVSQDQRDLPDWLDELYWAIKPAYDSRNEDKAPTPTHFDLMNDAGQRWRFPIEAYKNLKNPINVELVEGLTYYLGWVFKQDSGQELQLGISGFTAEKKKSTAP